MGFIFIILESLEELTELTVPLFSNVVNKNVDIPEWKEHPFNSDNLKVRIICLRS